MYTAGGRLFVDIAPQLSSPAKRNGIVNVLGKDPLIKDALSTIIDRGFIKLLPEETNQNSTARPLPNFDAQIEYDPAIVPELIKKSETSIETLRQNIQTKSGAELVDFIIADNKDLRAALTDPKSFAVIMTSMNTVYWINDKMNEWLGEKNAADKLSQSVPNNITSEMGLELLDVADIFRPYPDVIKYLQHTKDDNFLDELPAFKGGQQARDAIITYLHKYGMRCVGEIEKVCPLRFSLPTIHSFYH